MAAALASSDDLVADLGGRMAKTDDDGSGTGESLSGALLGLRRSRVNATEAEPNRTWDRRDWAEDHRYVDALDAIARGLKGEAVKVLVNLYKDDPGHLFGRALLLTLAVETGNEAVAREHVEWAIGFHTQQARPQDACEAFRGARTAFPQLPWNEKPLVQALVCASKCADRRAVLDAAACLQSSYPRSAAIPKAFFASAAVHDEEGRIDLARATLESIVQRFPLDPIAELAQRKLKELGSAAVGTPSVVETVPSTPPVRLPSMPAEMAAEELVRGPRDEDGRQLEEATREPLLPILPGSDDPWDTELPELPAQRPDATGPVRPARLPETPSSLGAPLSAPTSAAQIPLPRSSEEVASAPVRVVQKAAKEARNTELVRKRRDPRADPESEPAAPRLDAPMPAVDVPRGPRTPSE